jgi:Zn-dependent protease with chaperone function
MPLGDGASSLPAEVGLSVEEYRSVRQEEIVAMQSQISTLRYGVTGSVVLIGIAAQQHADKYLGWAISLALVPLVLLFSAVIWMGEYERMARAGHYVAILERRLNDRLGESRWRPLTWESWLREGGASHPRIIGGQHRYLTIACVFVGFQVAAVAMGLHFYWHQHAHDPARNWLIPTAVAVNLGILLTLLGYFRSSYERLRDFTADPEERGHKVRPRLRIRIRLYSILALVAFISAPIWSWPLGIYSVHALNDGIGEGKIGFFWAAWPTAIWIVLVPLLASRAVMHELLAERALGEAGVPERAREQLEDLGLLDQLTEWERARLRVVVSDELNAGAMGRRKSVTVTSDTLRDNETFKGRVAHEVAHHRLQHLHPLALSYLYLWPYLYYDDEVCRRIDHAGRGPIARLLCISGRALFTALSLPGWLGWVVLRLAWRTAEYDADRFAVQAGYGSQLRQALDVHEDIRLRRRPPHWRDRLAKGLERVSVEQGRSLGVLPVPNEHPIPSRRRARLKRWEWSRHNRWPGVAGPPSHTKTASDARVDEDPDAA